MRWLADFHSAARFVDRPWPSHNSRRTIGMVYGHRDCPLSTPRFYDPSDEHTCKLQLWRQLLGILLAVPPPTPPAPPPPPPASTVAYAPSAASAAPPARPTKPDYCWKRKVDDVCDDSGLGCD